MHYIEITRNINRNHTVTVYDEQNCNQCATVFTSHKLKNQLNISWKTAIILQAEMAHTATFKDAYALWYSHCIQLYNSCKALLILSLP